MYDSVFDSVPNMQIGETWMNKDRLGAFMDAVIAIVMTILVLELDKESKYLRLCVKAGTGTGHAGRKPWTEAIRW